MKNVEDIYALSPMQQGLLFHTLYEAGAGAYVEQLHFIIQGELDVAAFQRAWQHVVERHPVLRTGFVWQNVNAPLQIVRQRVRLPWEAHDWRAIPPAEADDRLAAFAGEDRARGFDLAQAPLMRLTLFQTGERGYHCFWTYHHLVLDGWSAPLALDEVFSAYDAFVGGRAVEFGRVRPYRDYIAWLQQQDAAKAEAFWRRALAGISAPTPFGVDNPVRFDGGAAGSGERSIRLSERATSDLQALARRHSLTLNTLVQGAWALLLARNSRERDVVYGATLAGRPADLPGVETMIGMFINTLPVRVSVPPGAQLIGWLQEIQAQQAELRQYEYSSLVQIQGWSEIPRGQPLFESIVVFENYPVAAHEQQDEDRPPPSDRPDLRVRIVPGEERANYPLTLVARPAPVLELRISYDRSRFDDDSIVRMLDGMQTLLDGMVADPARTLSALPILSEAERRRVLIEWNDTAFDYPHGRTLDGLFAEQAARTPDAVAVVADGRHMTYRELDARADGLAQVLRRAGVGPEMFVGVCMERSPEAIQALLGVLKAGSAFLPLDPAYPPARLAYMLRDSAVSVLVAHAPTLPAIRALAHDPSARPRAVVRLDRADGANEIAPGVALYDAAEVAPDAGPLAPARPERLAYMMYTSGSTGAPKGVPISHASAAPFFAWYGRYFGLRADDQIIQYHSLSFDFSTWEIFETLLAGAALHIVSADAARDVSALVDYLGSARISVLNMTPSQFGAVADYFPHAHTSALRTLRTLVLGGELLPTALAQRAAQILPPDCRIYNEYGPTETTISSSIFRVTPEALARYADRPGLSIGRPIGNTQFYLLDAQLQPTPIGAPGELYIGGFGLARGYHRRPDLTAERFMPNPFAQGSGVWGLGSGVWGLGTDPEPQTLNPEPRLYRTGDLARYGSDGSLEFLGRIDDQVKLRGYRIELDEIAAVVTQHPAIREAVALVREDAPGDRRIVAYIVQGSAVSGQGPGVAASDNLTPDPRSLIPDLRAWLAARLPDYMTPAAFVVLEALPLSPNGKLDRKALPAPDERPRDSRRDYAAPRTPVEEVLAQIWANLLGVDLVGVDDQFFELGGHSLLATQAIARVREAFQVEIPLRSLFESPTVAALAQQIEAARQGATDRLPPPIRPAPRDGAIPLSFAQQRLWFLDQLDPGSPAYNIPLALRLRGRLDLAALRAGLGALVRRHESLRTSFTQAAGQPAQVILPADAAEAHDLLALIDLRDRPAAAREALALRLADQEARRPFDLARAPLLHGLALRLAGDDHMLLITLHHIISDGWSMGVFIGELTERYRAALAGAPADLPDLPIQYADYALWQRAWLQGDVLDEQIAYWRDHLAGTATLQLPTDRPRPALPSFQGARHEFALPGELLARLAALARREGVTLFMLTLAAWQALLARYSGQDDVVVGTPIANRTRQETERLIGFFVNTLALRADMAGDPTFRALLRQVRDVCLGAYAHQDLPFEQVVEAIQPARDLSRHPLFQVTFVLQNAGVEGMDLPGLATQPLALGRETVKFDLSLSLAESDRALAGMLEYATDLFDAATVERMAGHLQTLMEGIAARPEARLSDLPILTADERRALTTWNSVSADFPLHQCAHQLFEAQAARSPDAVALVYGESQLTYRVLNTRANQLAHRLIELGAGPDAPVALFMDRSHDMAVGLLGIFKAGAVYMPLDPTHPHERLAFMLGDAQVALIATHTRLAAALPTHAAQLVRLDADAAAIERQPRENPVAGATPGHAAYIIYTSGTTGRPKGVIVEHRNLVNTLCASSVAFNITGEDALPFIAPIAFDIALFELLSPLMLGGRSIMVVTQQALELPQFTNVLRAITFLHGVPGLLRAIVNFIRAERRNESYRNLRQIFVGGDVIPPDLAHDLQAIFPAAQVYLAYGPTEGSIIATNYRVSPDRPAPAYVIGKPLPNMRARLYDRNENLAPIGVAGELYLGGAGVARGYLNQAGATAEKFVLIDGQRWYRTGDLARYLPDGNLTFVGRIDTQVKIRGFRIELGEIEAALLQHPAVRECVAAARADVDASAEKRLVAYVVTSDEVGGTSNEQNAPDSPGSSRVTRHASRAADLRAFLARTLPEYMIPSAFVLLDALPLTANGKVNRNALPAPEQVRPSMVETFAPPRTPDEEILAQIWAGLLRIDRVGVHDNFFDLGGHSLLATQLVSQLRETFEVEVPLRAVFEAPTVAQQAERVALLRHSQPGAAIPPLRRAARNRPLPLSFAQQRLWFLDQMDPGGATYNIPLALRLVGPLDVGALDRSLRTIVERQESLRTIFTLADGQPTQTILPPEAISLVQIDVRPMPAPEREAEVVRLARDEAERPFDLARGPLFRATLIRVRDEEHALLATMHHIISDGWSVGVFLRELTQLYAAYAAGDAPDLPALPVQYADFAVWQRGWLQGAALEAQLGYWRDHLADLPTLQLPTDRPRPAAPSFRGATQRFQIAGPLADALAALTRQEGSTLFMALLTAWQAVLARYSGQDDIVVGTDIANRNRAEIEGLIGFFINQLALRTDLSGAPSFREALRRVRQTTLEAYSYQDVPFEQLVSELQVERHLNRTPLFQVKLILQNAPMQPPALPGLTLRPLMLEHRTAQMDLLLSMMQTAQGIDGELDYSVDLFEPETIAALAQHFQTLLAGAVAQPDQPLARLPLLTAAERRRILFDWNATDAPYPHEACVDQLFLDQAARTPDAVATVAGSAQIGYAALADRAAQLAAYLRTLGVGPEIPVALYLEPSLDLLVGLLGVLMAGGAYLPLDPSYPQERIAYMLDDSQAPVILTQARLFDQLPATWAYVTQLDAEWETIAAAGPAPSSAAHPENLAYIIYTSGSTGRPKGVQLHQRGLSNLSAAQRAAFGARVGDRVLQFAALSFDAATWEVAMALLSGSTLCLRPPDSVLAGSPLAELLHDQAITIATLPPTALATLPAQRLPHLRTIIVAGEACPAELAARWADGRRFVNAYGPTETTVCATLGAASAQRPSPPIGRPIGNTRAYLLDAQLQPTPAGVPGELYLAGAGVARGYLRRPDLTAERFVPNPFVQGSGVWGLGADPEPRTRNPDPRLYRTGDLARYLPTGEIEYLGRIDHQVKLRGFRIELGEVEAALLRHAGVREALALVREDAPGQRRLVAYVVPHQGSGVGGQGSGGPAPDALIPEPRSLIPELRAFLADRLPDYMIPAAFVALDAWPITPNGKIDRKALPAPEAGPARPAGDVADPTTPAEAALAQIWAEVLRVDRVGIDDNFFALGGDSILSIQVITRAGQAGIRLTPKQLFQHQTIRELAAVAGSAPEVAAEQGLVTGEVLLTPIQRWFFAQDLADPHHYNQAQTLEATRPLDAGLLARALRQLIAHHDTLRLRFARTPDGWVQTSAGMGGLSALALLDLAALPPDEHARAMQAAARDLQASLDLARGPIVRVALISGGPGLPDSVLMIVHHLAVDAVSWRTLLDDLQSAYAQLQQGAPAALPPKTTSFQQWAARLHAYAQSDAARADLAYWSAAGADPPAALPRDHAGGPNTVASAREVVVALDAPETTALLQQVPPVYQTQITDVLLAALVQALTPWTGQADLLIALEGHGREDLFDDVDITRTVGWFTTLFPVRLDLRRAADPGAAIKAIKEQLRAIPSQGFSYGALRYLCDDPQVAEALRALPEAQLSFNYLGQNAQDPAEDQLLIPTRAPSGPAQSPRARRAHLLEINSVVAGDQLYVAWTYSEQVHDQATVERLAHAYISALRALIAHCQSPEAGGYTPSDFAEFAWDQEELDDITAAISKSLSA